jgi:hypothetical protein
VIAFSSASARARAHVAENRVDARYHHGCMVRYHRRTRSIFPFEMRCESSSTVRFVCGFISSHVPKDWSALRLGHLSQMLRSIYQLLVGNHVPPFSTLHELMCVHAQNHYRRVDAKSSHVRSLLPTRASLIANLQPSSSIDLSQRMRHLGYSTVDYGSFAPSAFSVRSPS